MGEKFRNTLLTGTLAIGTVIGLFYFFHKSKQTKSLQKKEISRDLLVLILKDLNKEMFHVLKKISYTSRAILKQTQRSISVQQMKAILHGNGKDEFHIEKEILKTRKEVYKKYGVDDAEVDTALNITYKNDRGIYTIIKRALYELQEAYQGNLVISLNEFPAFLTSKVLFNILTRAKQHLLLEAKNHLPSKRSSISIEQEILSIVNNKNIADSIKEKIYKEEGLDLYDDAPEKIILAALAKYSVEIPDFKNKIKQLDTQTFEILNDIINGSNNVMERINSIGNELLELD